MYLLDAQRGARRRARVRDGMAHGVAQTRKALGTSARDIRNRVAGAAAVVSRAVHADQADDDVIVARVRTTLGRTVSHPHAIEVSARDGSVRLTGPIPHSEVDALLRAVRGVRGVREVVNRLNPHKHAGDVPGLQGGSGRRAAQPDVMQHQWSPATRMMMGSTGAAMAGYGISRGGVPGWLLTAGGAVLAARAATNLELSRLTGAGAGRRSVDIQKTITIAAPIEDVFSFWTCYENFPRFMSRVLAVRQSTHEGQSHWKVSGPAGVPVEFDAEIVELVSNQLLAWRTVEGSLIGHAGIVRFESSSDGGARVSIRMSYNPPGGWIGHGFASVLGADPKSGLDADLARMKTLLETGRVPHDAAQRGIS
jgi:uncharacterized membrane protein